MNSKVCCWLCAIDRGEHSRLNRGKFDGIRTQSIPRDNHIVAIPPRDEVKVYMEDRLTARVLVRLFQRHSIGLKGTVDYSGHECCTGHQCASVHWIDVQESSRMNSRNDQRVPFGRRLSVKESDGVRVFVHHVGGIRTVNDTAEQT